MEWTHLFAEPGARTAIDGVHPVTGRSLCRGETLEEVRRRYPRAELMSWESFRDARIAAQRAQPLTWGPTTEATYHEMLNVLPPAVYVDGGFLVGEPVDHDAETGAPRFEGYRQVGDAFYVGSRPMTSREFQAEMRSWRHR